MQISPVAGSLFHEKEHQHDDSREPSPPTADYRPANLFDPVSGHGFDGGSAPISAVYRGRAYYFEKRENRYVFVADPEKYLASAQVVGDPVGAAREYGQGPHQRHGC